MRAILFSLLLMAGSANAMDKAAFSEAYAVAAVHGGYCGFMPLGTGLVNGKGWLHQPIPGKVEVHTESDGGTIQTIEMKNLGIPPQHSVTIDMDAGRPYYVIVNWAMSNDKLVWKVPGYAEGAVPLGFQLAP